MSNNSNDITLNFDEVNKLNKPIKLNIPDEIKSNQQKPPKLKDVYKKISNNLERIKGIANDEKEKQRYEMERKLTDEVLNTYNEWKKDYTSRTGLTTYPINPFLDSNRKKEVNNPDSGLSFNSKNRDIIIKQIRDYNTFLIKKQKERVDKLKKTNPEEYQKELKFGGINKLINKSVGNISQAVFGFMDALTLGATDFSKDKIYGNDITGKYDQVNSLGRTAGDIASFFIIGKLLGKTPLSKAYDVGKAGKFKTGALKLIGTPSAWIKKMAGIEKGLGTLTKATINSKKIVAGANAVSMIITSSFKDHLGNAISDYIHQDGLFSKDKNKNWAKIVLNRYGIESINSALGGFILATINSPHADYAKGASALKAWTARFLGDGAYSAGSQVKNMILGIQQGWDQKQFVYNWMMGHVIGEAQGVIFSPTRKQWKAYRKNKEARKYGELISKRLEKDYGIKLSDGDLMMTGISATEAERQYINAKKKEVYDALPEGNRPSDISKVKVKLNKNYRQEIVNKLVEINQLTYDIKLDVKNGGSKDLNKIDVSKDLGKKQIESFAKNISLTPTEKNYLLNNRDVYNDNRKLLKYLKAINKHVKSTGTKEVEIPNSSNKLEPTRKEVFENFLETRLKDLFNDVNFDKVVIPKETRGNIVYKVNKSEPSKISSDDFLKVVEYKNKLFNYFQDHKNYKNLVNFANIKAKNAEVGRDIVNNVFLYLKNKDNSWFVNKVGKYTERKLLTGLVNNFSKESLRNQYKDASLNVKAPNTDKEILDTISVDDSINKQINYSDPKYTLLSELASKNNTGVVKALITYLKNESNLRYTNQEIVDVFNKNGIVSPNKKPYTIDKIKKLYAETKKDIQSIIDNPPKQVKKIDYKIKYSTEDISNLKEREQKKILSKNILTGLNSELNDPYAIRRIKNTGGMVLDLSRQYKRIKDKMGSDTADRFIAYMGGKLKSETDKYIETYIEDKNKLQQIFIKNPNTEDNGKFILYQRDLSPEKLNEFLTYIKDRLDGSSPDNKFLFGVKTPTDKTAYLSSFQDFDIYKINDISDYSDSIIDKMKITASVLDDMRGMKYLLPLFNNVYIDKTNPATVNKLNEIKQRYNIDSMTDDQIIDYLHNKANTKLIDKDIEDLLRIAEPVKEYKKPIEIKAQNPLEHTGKEKTDVAIDNSLQKDPDTILLKLLKMDNEDFISQDVTEKYKEYIEDFKAKVAKKKQKESESGAKKWIGSVKRYFKNRSSVYGEDVNNPALENMKLQIFAHQGGQDQIKSEMHKLLVDPIYAELATYNTKQMVGLDKLGNFIREKSFAPLVQDKNIFNVPIKNKEEIEFIIKKIKKNPNSITGKDLSALYRLSGDRDVYGKIAVQDLGISNKDLINYLDMMNDNVYKFVRGVKGKNEGSEYADINYFSEKRQQAFNKLSKMLKDNYSIDISTFKNKEDGYKTIKELIENNVPEDNIKERFLKYLDIFDKFRPENGTYTAHRVIQDKNGKALLNGIINKFLSGHNVTGSKSMDPLLRDFMGRTFATLNELIDAGHTVETSAYKTMSGMVQYAGIKRLNDIMANSYKWGGYIDKLYSIYKPNGKDGEVGDIDAIAEFIRSQGYLVKPSKQEIIKYSGIRKKLVDSIETIVAKDNKTQLDNQKLNTYKTWLNKIEDKLRKIKMISSIWENESLRSVLDDTINGMDSLMPLNYKAMEEDEYLPKIIKKKVEETTRSDTHKNIIELNLPGWDGIYVPLPVYKGLVQFVQRANLYKNNLPFFVNGTFKLFDRVNVFMKMSKLIQPFYMLVNDAPQSFTASGFSHLKNIKQAIKIGQNKHNLDYNKNAFLNYNDFNTYGHLFGSSVQPNAYVSDINEGFYDMVLHPKGMGNWLFKLFRKTLGTRAYQWKDDIAHQNTFLKKMRTAITSGVKAPYSLSSSIAWKLDETIRLTVALDYFKKIYPQKINEAIDANGGKPLTENQKLIAKRKALFFSGNVTTLFMINYERIPHQVRRNFLNRLFMYPTFKVGTYRMYKELFKQAGRSIYKHAGSKDLNYDEFGNFASSIAPLVRNFALGYAWKYGLAHFMGYGFSGIYDFLTGYRATKQHGTSIRNGYVDYLSFGSSLFALQKVYSRKLKDLTLSLSGILGIYYQLLTNKDFFNNNKIYDPKDARYRPIKAMAEIGLWGINKIDPFHQHIESLTSTDKTIIQKVLQLSGLAYFFRSQTGVDLVKKFNEAIDESKTPYDQQKAYEEFRKGLSRITYILNKGKFNKINKKKNEILFKNLSKGE